MFANMYRVCQLDMLHFKVPDDQLDMRKNRVRSGVIYVLLSFTLVVILTYLHLRHTKYLEKQGQLKKTFQHNLAEFGKSGSCMADQAVVCQMFVSDKAIGRQFSGSQQSVILCTALQEQNRGQRNYSKDPTLIWIYACPTTNY